MQRHETPEVTVAPLTRPQVKISAAQTLVESSEWAAYGPETATELLCTESRY